jgi:hypothetical protein
MAMTKALKEWETRNGKVAAEEKDIRLYGGLMFENNTKRLFVNKLVRGRGASSRTPATPHSLLTLSPLRARVPSPRKRPPPAQDVSLSTLKACERLALSTNQIDRMT